MQQNKIRRAFGALDGLARPAEPQNRALCRMTKKTYNKYTPFFNTWFARPAI